MHVIFGARGARDGAVVRALASHRCGSVSNPGVDAICGLSFVVGFLPCSKRFFSGYSGLSLSSKTISSKFHFDQESGRDEEPLCGCATSKSLFIIYFIMYYLYTCKTVVLLIQSSFFAVLVAVVVGQSWLNHHLPV